MLTPFLFLFALPGPQAAWDVLTKGPTLTECTESSGAVYCRSTAVFDAKVDVLAQTITTMASQADKFDSIIAVNTLEPDVLHVVMDFPAPLADRDYVARFKRVDRDDGGLTLVWTPVIHDKAPPTDSIVRLEGYEGSWSLTPISETQTRVEYLWLGTYGGALPSFALNTARKKTAVEAMKDLSKASGGVSFKAP